MPKLPGGITKSKRQDTLRRVLRRWGRLNKQQIDQYVANACHTDPDSLSRSLYRDLEELVSQNDIKVHYFTRDGVEILDYDPDVHKNTYCEWSTLESDLSLVGGQYLNRLNVFCSYSKRIEGSFSVDSGDGPPVKDKLNLYFLFEGKILRVLVDPQSVPLTFLLARRPDDEEELKIFQTAEEKLGKRLAVVLVPTRTLSGTKGTERIGHFLVKLEPDSKARVSDLGSKNGTQVLKVNRDQAISILEKETSQQNATRSLLGNDVDLDHIESINCATEQVFDLPVVVEASRFFRLVVI